MYLVPSTPSDWNITFWLSPWGRQGEKGKKKEAEEEKKKKKRNASFPPFIRACVSSFLFPSNGPCITMACLPCMTLDDSRAKDERRRKKREEEEDEEE